MPPPTATPLVTGNALPVALQALNIALAEIADRVKKLVDLHGKQATATDAAAKATTAANLSLGNLTGGFVTLRNVTGLALNSIQQLTGAISSQVASFVSMYSPVETIKLNLALRDLQAAIGVALLPLLQKLILVVRGIGDTIASLSPSARSLIAALAAAGVGMVVMTVATEALSAAIAGATGGLSLVLGAVVGGLASIALVSKDFAAVKGAVESVTVVARQFMEVLGQAFARVVAAAQPVIDLVGRLAGQLAGPFVALVEQIGTVITGVIEQIVPALTALLPAAAQMGQALWAIDGVLLTLLGTALKPVLQVIATLAPVVAAIGAPFRLFAQVLGTVLQVAATVGGVIADVLLTPLRIAGAVFEAVSKVVVDVFGDLQGAFGEVGALATELAGIWKEVMAALAGEFKPLVDFLKDGAAAAVRSMLEPLKLLAGWIREVVRAVREFFGIAARERIDPKGKGEGLAVRQVTSGDIMSVVNRAQQNAIAAGRTAETSPIVKAANHLQNIEGYVKDIKDGMATLPNTLGDAIRGAVGGAGNALSPAQGAGVLGGMLSIGDVRMITG